MRFIIFLSIVLGIWLAQHLYVGWRLSSLSLFAEGSARKALWIGLGVAFVSYPLSRFTAAWGWNHVSRVVEYCGAVWMGVVFLLLVTFFVTDLATLFGFVFKSRLGTIRTAAAAIAVTAALIAWVTAALPPRVLEFELEFDGLSAAIDGTKIVQVSDVHLGSLVGQRRWNTILARVATHNADIVVVTGDLVDGDVREVEPMLDDLRRLTAPLGVFAVLGNHEFYAGAAASRQLMLDAGWRVLDYQAVEVRPGLVIVGVPDRRAERQTGQESSIEMEQVWQQILPEATTILLQHSPGGEKQAAEAGVDLMLNGHTHGGQIWPFGLLVMTSYRNYAGVYHVGEMTQIVSRGAGHWGPPMRLFAPSDIVAITLRTAE
jgi:predicted MPP superfamily phosphohydrolase